MWLTGAMRRLTQTGKILPKEMAARRVSADRSANCGTRIADFEPEEDALVCIWDDSDAETAPPVTVEADPDHAGQVRVRLGDRTVARVSGRGTIEATEVSMLPLSSARALGLAGPDSRPLQ